MRPALSALLHLFGLALFLAPPAPAAVVGAGTPASCTEAALDAAIADANANFGLVTFNCGSAPFTLTVTTQKSLGNGVAIDGGDKITLSGGHTTRIFDLFPGVAVEIRSIKLEDGAASPGGGCIEVSSTDGNESTLVLSEVTLEGCRADQYGGAIAATEAFLVFSGVTFINDVALNGGGGALALNSGTLDASGSSFFAGQANTQGGGIQAWSSQLTLSGSLFQSNETTDSNGDDSGGAGLVLRSSNATVSDCEFIGNFTARNGGAVLLQLSSNASFADSTFTSNSAFLDGGAIYADASSAMGASGSSFASNNGEDGGAVYSRFALAFQNTTFYDNHAVARGYALFLELGTLVMVSSTFSDNWSSFGNLSGQLAWAAGSSAEVHNSLLQSPRRNASACSAGGGGTPTATVWDDGTCPPGGAGSRPNTVIQLGPYGFSCGGAAAEKTRTLPLRPESAALFAGSCRPADPIVDQRGRPRPSGASCDVGAAEFTVACDAPFFADGFETGNTGRWGQTLP